MTEDNKNQPVKSGIDTQKLGVALDALPRININNAETVRRQSMSHVKEIMVTFRLDGVQFNSKCISMLDSKFILMMHDMFNRRYCFEH